MDFCVPPISLSMVFLPSCSTTRSRVGTQADNVTPQGSRLVIVIEPAPPHAGQPCPAQAWGPLFICRYSEQGQPYQGCGRAI